MGTPFVGEMRIYAFSFPPKGWAFCNGQILAIAQNQALFALLGTTYGGNGTTTFALPDMRGRTALSAGQGSGLSPYQLGQQTGEENHTLLLNEVPPHTHTLIGNSAAATTGSPAGLLAAQTPTGLGEVYGAGAGGTTVSMSQSAIAAAGGLAHENRQPYLALNFCIALVGVFPPHN